MKSKYKATPKTYASQARCSGKVTTNLVRLLSRANVHVEEKELKSISTEPNVRAPAVYASGGVVGYPRFVEGGDQLLAYTYRDVEVIQGHHRALAMGEMHRITRFDPPINVRAEEELILGSGRLFIGNTDDPESMREVGVARNVRVDLASSRDRVALVQMDFAGVEARVVHNFHIQSLISEQMVREMNARMDEEMRRGGSRVAQLMSVNFTDVAESTSRLADAVASTTLTVDSMSEALSRANEMVFGGRQFGRQFGRQTLAQKKKKKQKQSIHPDAGKTIVRRKVNRTLLGVAVVDIRVGSGAIRRTAQSENVVRKHRRRNRDLE